MTAAAPVSSVRRRDLDWLRVGAFGLLIGYHVMLAYGPYDWHVHSRYTFEWVREAVLVTNPWRLTLLFLVSGAALRFMSIRRSAGQVLRQRLERLGPPLVFGVLVLVTIQSWIEALDKGGFSGGYLAWLAREFSPSGIANGVPFNHLWFVLYIAVYSLVAVWLMSRPHLIERWGGWLERNLTGWRVLAVPMAYLVVIRVCLFPIFGLTNNLPVDWYNHASSLAAFLFGFLIVGRESIWKDIERFRWVAVGIAAVALPLMMAQVWHPGGGAFLGVPRNAVVAVDQWAVIVALLGFGSRRLRDTDSRVLRYLTDAIFPLYLAHQTILVMTIWLMRDVVMPAPVEALTLVAITLGGSLLVYEIVRRIPLIRPVWGLKPLPPPAPETPGRYRDHHAMLHIGVAAPVIAMAIVAAAALAYPGFDNATQYLSELGGHTARWPMIFNVGVFIAGIMAAIAGLGFGLSLAHSCRAPIAGGLTAMTFILAGAGLSLSTLWPWPDPRHMVINLGLGIQIAPLLLLWGLAAHRDTRRLQVFLAGVFVVMAVLTLYTKHVIFPGTVNDSNVGWWERAYAIVLVGWVGIAAHALNRRLRAEATPDGDLAGTPPG